MIIFVFLTVLLGSSLSIPPPLYYPQCGCPQPCQPTYDQYQYRSSMYPSAYPPCMPPINVVVQPEEQQPPPKPPAPEPPKAPPAPPPTPPPRAPNIAPSRLFTSLFSLPGVLADSLLSGEINLLAL